MPELGPISESLFREVAREVHRQGIVVWLDRDNHYTSFVDGLIRERGKDDSLSFPIIAFRGSFLELLLAIEPYGNGLGKESLLVHMPGFNEDMIRQTPMLELYDAGVRFRKALDTLIREAAHARVASAEVEAFRAVVAAETARPDPPPGPLPLESVDEILLLMSWFRAHPDALRRTTPLSDWLPDRSSSPGDTSGPPPGSLLAASDLLTTI